MLHILLYSRKHDITSTFCSPVTSRLTTDSSGEATRRAAWKPQSNTTTKGSYCVSTFASQASQSHSPSLLYKTSSSHSDCFTTLWFAAAPNFSDCWACSRRLKFQHTNSPLLLIFYNWKAVLSHSASFPPQNPVKDLC